MNDLPLQNHKINNEKTHHRHPYFNHFPVTCRDCAYSDLLGQESFGNAGRAVQQ